ncbi:MAG: diacylglycerol kinase [Gemmataceae bacterium]
MTRVTGVVMSDPGSPPADRRRRGWGAKFATAARGVKLGVRGQSSFSVHAFFTASAVAASAVLGCDPVEWGLVILCIGLVLTAELLNSSVELLFRGLEQPARDRVYGCLDIAAGAVLVASATAAAVGGIVIGRRLLLSLGLLGA